MARGTLIAAALLLQACHLLIGHRPGAESPTAEGGTAPDLAARSDMPPRDRSVADRAVAEGSAADSSPIDAPSPVELGSSPDLPPPPSWTMVPSGTQQDLLAVTGAGGEVFIVGEGGTVLKAVSSKLVPMASGTPNKLTAV